MRVAFQIDQLWFEAPGGIGTYVRELLPLLSDDEGVELLPFHGRFRRSPPLALLSPAGQSTFELPVPIKLLYPAWDYLRRPALPTELGRADIVHATNPAAVPPVRSGQKLVVSVHDLTFERFPEMFPPRWLRLYRRGVKVALEEAAAILVPSVDVRDDLIARGAQSDRILVTPLGSAMREPTQTDHLELADHGLAPPFILFAGTIEPRKNLVRLVRAYRRLADEGLPHALALVGPNGWGAEALQQELEGGGPGRVIRAFLPIGALAAAYASASAVAYVSLYEGFGLPVLEAMSLGAPVLTSNVSALPEVAGGAAILVDPTDEDAIADELRRIVTDADLRAELSRLGREHAAGFSWGATSRATVDAYRRVLT